MKESYMLELPSSTFARDSSQMARRCYGRSFIERWKQFLLTICPQKVGSRAGTLPRPAQGDWDPLTLDPGTRFLNTI